MSIEEYIQQEVLARRLKSHEVLVVYDGEGRYRRACQRMAAERVSVVDASEGSIESREQALNGLQRLGRKELDGLLVYVPVEQPLEPEAKQKDPFALYAACGAVFPNRYKDGDSFENLCLTAKPDHAAQIREVFRDNPAPDFAVIDAIGQGMQWPNLRALLSADSAGKALLALLAPSDSQRTALGGSDTWVGEARELLKSTLGLKLRTRGKTWSSIADELWRYVLFSEFVFDLPGELPGALVEIPRAGAGERAIIEGLCEDLRNDRRTQAVYIDRAEEIEAELSLPEHCRALTELGVRDTFAFEERTFLHQAVTACAGGEIERAREILRRRESSVWTGKGENRGQWYLVDAASHLIAACDDHQRELSGQDGSLERLVGLYVSRLHEVDRHHREFEQAVSDVEWQDTHGVMAPLIQKTRQRYARLVEKTQQRFTQQLEQTGWPVPGYLSNAEVFDRLVAPKLRENGHKVAYIMVDALRYELGVALEKQLAEDGAVEVQAAMAKLPTVTPVGMASLLPGASEALLLERSEQGVIPKLGGKPVASVPQRMDAFRRLYGQRFAELRLEQFVRGKGTFGDEVDLLVLRSVEIDSHFENHPDTAPAEILNALKRIRMAIYKLADRGFRDVVIVTDHGFCINTHAGAGDRIDKPNGDWVIVHDRCALGDGSTDDHHLVTSAEKVGIRGDFSRFAAPRSLAAYRAGLAYYHGGVSLQECVVPVITMRLKRQEQPDVAKARVSISYKNGAKRVTTRVPVIDVAVDAADMFSREEIFEILLEAHDLKGEVVGEAKPGGAVNPATGTLALQAGDKTQVTLKMLMEFEGKFRVKALDPRTNTVFCHLDLETDYTV